VVAGFSAMPKERLARVDLLGDGRDGGQVGALLGQCPGDLLHEHGGAGAAPPGGVERVLDRHVVVDQDRADLDALLLGQLAAIWKLSTSPV